MTEFEKYRGKGKRDELRSAAVQRCSGEVARAVTLLHEHVDRVDVKKANGTKAVSFNMKVAENLFTGRLVWVEPSALRRTRRCCGQMLRANGIGINTRGHLEYLRERADEEMKK